MDKAKAPTSVDVARRAGVSQTTVSLVFRGTAKAAQISDSTRQKVLQAAREIGYRPNHAAQSLRQNRTNLIGLATTLYTTYSLGLIRAGRKTAVERGHQLVVLAAEDRRADLAALDQAARGSVDAIIISPRDDETMAVAVEVAARGRPVILSGPNTTPELPAVRLDLEQAGFLATDHLIGRGHRRIGYIAPVGTEGDGRLIGYRQAHAAADITPREELMAFDGHSPRGGFDAIRRLLEAGRPRPTAVFTYNEEMAIGALAGLRAAGVRVPEDVAVVGCNESPVAEFMAPPLSTVALPGEEAGRLAVEMAISASTTGQPATGDHLVPAQLIVRASSDYRRRAPRR